MRLCFNYLSRYLKGGAAVSLLPLPQRNKVDVIFFASCFLFSRLHLFFAFCFLLSAFLVVIAVHVCYGGRGGLAGASIDLIWAFSASGFDTLTCLFKFGIWHSAYLLLLTWYGLLVPVALTLTHSVVLAFSLFVALLLSWYGFCFKGQWLTL